MVFAAALLLRLIALDWGLPSQDRHFSLHPDEPIVLAASRAIEPAQGNFAPGFYNYGTLYLTLSRVAGDVALGWPGVESEPAWSEARRLHLAGRVVSALAGAWAALLVVLLLLPRAGRIGAIAGGIALAFASGHVEHSRFQTVDVVATALALASLLYASRLASSEGDRPWRDALLAGVFAGLAAGAKYGAGLTLVGLVVAALLRFRALGLRHVAAAASVALLAFLITTPGALIEWEVFSRDLRYEFGHVAEGHGLVFAGTTSGWVYHLGNLTAGYGALALALSFAGLWLARRAPWCVPLLVFAALYYVTIARADVKFFRYTLPLFPVLAAGFGVLVGRAASTESFRGRLGLVGCLIVLGGMLAASARITAWMLGPDPRFIAAQHLRRAHPDGVVGLVSDPWFYTPTLYPETAMPRPLFVREGFAAMDRARRPRVLRHLPVDPAKRIDWDLRLLDEDQPDVVVYTSFETEGLSRFGESAAPPDRFRLQIERYRAFQSRLRQDYEVEAIYGVGGPSIHDLMYVYPSVVIWKRRTDSSRTSNGSSTTSDTSAAPAPTR